VTKFAPLFMHGRRQAVRLPKEFRFPGDRVRISRVEDAVLLKPAQIDVDELFRKLDKYRDIPFMENGREQPPMPPDENLFD